MPRRSLLAATLAGWLGGGSGVVAAWSFDEAARSLLVEAVEVAYTLDAFNARCRRDQSGRHMDNLNKVLAGRLRTTVLRVQDEFFPERDYRRAQARMQDGFTQRLDDAGGCAVAREDGLHDRWRADYDRLTRAIANLY